MSGNRHGYQLSRTSRKSRKKATVKKRRINHIIRFWRKDTVKLNGLNRSQNRQKFRLNWRCGIWLCPAVVKKLVYLMRLPIFGFTFWKLGLSPVMEWARFLSPFLRLILGNMPQTPYCHRGKRFCSIDVPVNGCLLNTGQKTLQRYRHGLRNQYHQLTTSERTLQNVLNLLLAQE